MSFIFIILLVLLILIILLFTISLKVKLLFDTVNEDMNVTLLWLKPMLKVILTVQNSTPLFTLYLFNKKIMGKFIRPGKSKSKIKLGRMELIKLTDASDININTSYGFKDPFATGITCGAINAASQFVNIDSLKQSPDFMAENDYIYLDATAKVNVGSTLVKMLKTQFSH